MGGAAAVPTTRWVRRPEALWRSTLGGVVLLASDRAEADPTILSGTGASVWSLLEEPRSVAELATSLSASFEGDVDVIAADVEQLVSRLRDDGLVVARS